MPHPQLQHALQQLDASRAEQHARRQAANPPPDPARQAEQHAQQTQRQQAVRSWAAQLWQQAQPPDPQHPYLQRHAIQPVGARQMGNLLLIPLRIRQQMVNLQLIRPSGHSRLLCGTALDGAVLLLGPLRGQTQLLLCVGWASGCSLFHASGLSVIVARQTRNLAALAERLAVSLDPRIVLLVCGECSGLIIPDTDLGGKFTAMNPRCL
jgi:putative DNA primase/helicase